MRTIYLCVFVLNCVLTLGMNASAAQGLLSWQATVVRVVDGDTLDVRISGESSISRIRIMGIQAMETNSAAPNTPPSCHAGEATAFLENIIPNGATITLRAVSESSTSRGRWLRHVFFLDNGQEINIASEMLKSGMGFAFTLQAEPSFNEEYVDLQTIAQASKNNIWDDTFCGQGPRQDADLEVWLNADAQGNDSVNINGEWIKLRNNGSTIVDLSNWSLRDRFLNIFYFPANTAIQPGQTFTLFIGSGQNTESEFYLNSDVPIFRNNQFNSAYLMEPLAESPNTIASGDLRASFVTPDQTGCRDQNAGKLTLLVNFDAPGNDQLANPNGEFVNISNGSNDEISLQNYLLRSGSNQYSFPDQFKLKANSSVTVFVGNGQNTDTELYWGNSRTILNNTQGEVVLKTYDERLLDKFTWPTPSNLSLPELGRDCSTVPPDVIPNPNIDNEPLILVLPKLTIIL